VGEIGCEEV